jgi:hypothetical protein
MPRRPTDFLHLQLGPATYEFRRCYRGLPWNPVGGLYAFVGWPGYALIYIGETGSFATRLPGHEVWPLARRHGAREIYAMPFAGTAAERRTLERVLIGAYAPPLNTQHRAAGAMPDEPGLWFDPFDSFDAFMRQVR